MPYASRTLLIDIGGGSTEMARAEGEEPTELWSVPLGSVRLTEMFDTDESLTRERLTAIRRYAQRAIQEAIPARPTGIPRHALGSSGTIRAVCAFAAQPGSAHATRDGLTRAVEELVALGPSGRRRRFDAQRAQVLVAGAVILESLAHHLRIDSVTAVDGGLKEGLLVDLVRRSHQRRSDPLLSEAALAAGRKFSFDEAHAVFVRDLALSLYDQLEPLHQLPPDARMILEAAAVLHDVGTVVSRSRHHKHSLYLMANMDLPGLSDHERGLASLVARFHRRSPPKRDHAALAELNDVEFRLVRKLAVLVRIADAADRSRQQPVAGVDVVIGPRHAHLRLKRAPKKQLDAADLLSEEALFAAAFGRRLLVDTDRARRKRP
jgi:exopolyphosphatase/guanosine-5'-triphosphate,3'-diphosphate pyrophosphatase